MGCVMLLIHTQRTNANNKTEIVKVQLQHVLTAVAINLARIDAVLTHTSRGKTRRSNFVRMASHPSLQSWVGT